MAVSIYSIKQNLKDLEDRKKDVTFDIQDSIDRVADDMKKLLEILDYILADIKR